MTFYIVRRLTLLLPTIFLASVIIFVLMRSIPGDPASLQIGDESSRAQVDALKKQLGIDKPIYSSTSFGRETLSAGILESRFVRGSRSSTTLSGRSPSARSWRWAESW